MKKRINPDTGKPFVVGYIREDGYRFMGYEKKVKKDGYLQEGWASQDALERKKKHRRKKLDGKVPINPSTGKPYRRYEDMPDGRVFKQITKHAVDKDGFYRFDAYSSKEAMYKERAIYYWLRAKERSAKSNIPFEIEKEDVIEIFPKDMICPALGIKMTFGGKVTGDERWTSPSLDRIIPSKGYVKGNIIFVSLKANIIKQDATATEILKVGNFYKNLESKT